MRRLILVNVLFVLALCFNVYAKGSEAAKLFDKNSVYDLYVQTYQNPMAVINNVEILGFEEINGIQFIVIRSKDFKFQETQGYVRFDSVVAILGNGNFSVKRDLILNSGKS